MKRLLMTLTVALSVALSGAAFAQDTNPANPQVTAQVMELLSGIEHVPSADEWKALGPDAVVALREIAANPKVLPTRRSRAISILVSFNDDASFDTLTKLLKDQKSPEIIKRKALIVLAQGYGAKAVELVKPFAAHESRDVRESAIRALGAVNTPEAHDLLKARLKVEPKEKLREAIRARITVAK